MNSNINIFKLSKKIWKLSLICIVIIITFLIIKSLFVKKENVSYANSCLDVDVFNELFGKPFKMKNFNNIDKLFYFANKDLTTKYDINDSIELSVNTKNQVTLCLISERDKYRQQKSLESNNGENQKNREHQLPDRIQYTSTCQIDSLRFISIPYCKYFSIIGITNLNNVSTQLSTFSEAQILGVLSENSVFEFETIKTNIENSRFKSCHFNIRAKDSLTLKNITLEGENHVTLYKRTRIQRIKGNGYLYLSTPGCQNGEIVTVVLNDIDLNKLKFPEYGIDFIVDKNSQSFAMQIRLYEQLIKYYNNFPDLKKKYDIQRIKLINTHENNFIIDFISWHWNNYGYNKPLIFKNSILLMLLFFVINLFIFKKLLNNCYEISEINININNPLNIENYKTYRLEYIFYCLVYTSFIFWGINLKLDKIKLNNKGLFIYLIMQYVFGIICLAHIANIIITK